MPKLIKPVVLRPGDQISLVSPSEPIDKAELGKIIAFLEKSGYVVKPGKNVLAHIGDYSAGTAKERADDINDAFADKQTRAILVTVGGMVASQVLEHLNFELIKDNPKILTGYSDATTLQMAIFAKSGLLSFHSPNALSLPDFRMHGYTMTNFWRMVTMTSVGLIKPQSVWQVIRKGNASGILFGGNLSCICKLLGTRWDPLAALDVIFGKDTKYLFYWEEDYEQFSEIMRNLWQLKNAGFFEKVCGMIVGKLTAVKEQDYKDFPPKKQLILEATAPFEFPILYGVDFGHEVPKATLPLGVMAKMDTENSLLEVLESAVVEEK